MKVDVSSGNRLRRVVSVISTAAACGFMLCASWCSVQGQPGVWKRQPVASMAWLHAIFFVDVNHGWAVGSRGTILMTTDGGKSWQLNPQPTPDVLRDIYFIDDQNGWLLCETNIYELKTKEDPRTYLMQTVDGGKSWKRINIRGADVDARLVRAVFDGGGRGWAFGEQGTIFATRDAGANWTRLPSPTRHLLLGGVFIDEYRGWLVGAGTTIIQTSDGGETWHLSRLAQPGNQPVRFAAISFVDNRLGWAVGSRGTIYHTTNGGRTWQQQSSGVLTDLLDVKFVDALHGWSVGTEGTIISTNDGGLHWTGEPSGTEHPLERIFFVDHNHGWAVGFGGVILSYSPSSALSADSDRTGR